MITVDQAIDKVLDQRRQRQDFCIPLKRFSLTLDANGDNLVGVIDGQEYRPTDHCLRLMATKMNVPHVTLKKYNGEGSDQTDRELLVQLFKNGVRDGRVDPDKEFRFRTYTDGTLRAMLTKKYAIVDNVWCLEQIKAAFPNDPLEFAHFRGDADTIYGNMRIPGQDYKSNDSDYGGMIFVGNSEIGLGRVSVAPGVWRQVCTNGMMGWAPAWSKVHLGEIDLAELSAEIVGGIHRAIPKLKDGFDLMIAAQNRALGADPSKVIAEVADKYKLESPQARETLEAFGNHESQFRNLFGVVNAITRAAQKQKVDSEQFRMEEIGGKLCSMSDQAWQRLNLSALNLEDKAINKIYGLAN